MRLRTDTDMPVLGRLRRTAKTALQRLPTRQDAIVVASFGRAGSTLVYDAVVDAMARARFGTARGPAQRIVRDVAFDCPPDVFRRGTVYKTHDYPNILTGTGVRAIFLFGSATDAALSVHEQRSLRGEDWVRQHFEHLRRPYRVDRLLDEDVLGFRDQCVAWMGCGAVPVLCMRYENLWDNADKLSEFCGLDVVLPPFRARADKGMDPRLLEKARLVYRSLDTALETLPDCFVAGPEFSARVSA